MAGRRIVRIAHAHGNNRDDLQRALDSDVDMIECDVWHSGGRLWVHHERQLGILPLLADRRGRGRPLPPLSLPLGSRYFIRPDIRRLSLDELLERTAGRKRLLIDTKGDHDSAGAYRFAVDLAATIREHDARSWSSVCGQYYPILGAFREVAPEIEVRHSIEKPYQWQWFLERAESDEHTRQICISYKFLDDGKARYFEEKGVNLYCWTVDDPAEAPGSQASASTASLATTSSYSRRSPSGAVSGAPPSP